MATGNVISVVQTLFSVVTSQEFKEICSKFEYESQLDKLADTVNTVKAVLLDAESKHQELTHSGREFIEKLKDAVYDVDDVLDEFNTMVQKAKGKYDNKTLKKVRRFFSRSNPFLVAYNMSHEIKKIRETLDNIAKDRRQFGFTDVFEPPKKRKETGSYVREDGIIGREADTKTIVGWLLGESESSHENVGFVTIVGMGGLGKTALAQLVYNDKKIQDAFEVKLWVCVSNEFGMEQILAKMIERNNVGSRMEKLQREVRNKIEGKKYLLVLDDVWEENRNKWVELQDFLMLGGNGSRVLMTTRSKTVAGAIENNRKHILQGLSVESSWRLFQRMAFEQGKAPLDHDLVAIGKEVVNKCANVPLSIRVVGSLLYGQHKSKWLSFKSVDLRKMASSQDGQAEDGIMPILKYSYYHLSPSLKSCFSYCALFPKDFKISKRKLIWLWMAHGCLDVTNDVQSMEEVGDDYFSILVSRCFFQDVDEGAYGEIDSFKMHDLIHDLALEVAGKESLALETSELQFDQKIRLLSVDYNGCKLFSSPGSCLGEMKKLRSLHHNFNILCPPVNESNVDMICSNLWRLRVLDLTGFVFKSLPDTLGNLSHLRYLDLSYSRYLEILPESITKLHNLLVLNLFYCYYLRELPKGLRNLHNLRHLDLSNCHNLTHMPVGMDSMVSLRTMSMFVVAGKTSKHVNTGHLKDLRNLVHLKGRLEIIFKSGFSHNLGSAGEIGCLLSDKVHLDNLVIRWEEDASNEHGQEAINEILLEGLRPHSNIKRIEIKGHKGVKISSWVGSLAVFFQWLIEVSLHGFECLYNLPSISHLLHLKVLQLSSLPNVEFIEFDDKGASFDLISKASFFRSLEELRLKNLPKLKGVRNDIFSGTEAHKKLIAIQSFPCLRKLEIEGCPCLTAVPRCPGLKSLRLKGAHNEFRFGSINDNSPTDSTFYLEDLRIDKVGHVNNLFGESLKGIVSLCIRGFQGEMLAEAADVFQRHASSLRKLYLEDCMELKSLCGGGIEHLTNLTDLTIRGCSELELGEGDDCGMSPWNSLLNLRHLTLISLSNLVHLPQGFRHLTSLTTLYIVRCSLESLPDCLPSLTSLRLLMLQSCDELKSLPEEIRHMPALRQLGVLRERCRETDGQDWPKISARGFSPVTGPSSSFYQRRRQLGKK